MIWCLFFPPQRLKGITVVIRFILTILPSRNHGFDEWYWYGTLPSSQVWNEKLILGSSKQKPITSVKTICIEKKNPENQCHTQRMTHGHVHLLWLLGSGKRGGNASTRSGCQHSGSSAKCFHKYDNISDYSLLLAAVTHRHFGGVGGSKSLLLNGNGRRRI